MMRTGIRSALLDKMRALAAYNLKFERRCQRSFVCFCREATTQQQSPRRSRSAPDRKRRARQRQSTTSESRCEQRRRRNNNSSNNNRHFRNRRRIPSEVVCMRNARAWTRIGANGARRCDGAGSMSTVRIWSRASPPDLARDHKFLFNRIHRTVWGPMESSISSHTPLPINGTSAKTTGFSHLFNLPGLSQGRVVDI